MAVQEIQLEVVSDPRLLAPMRALVRSYLRGLGFSSSLTEEVVLAVDEACSNAVRHAYKGRTDGRLELCLASDKDCVEFVLRDQGDPAPRDRVQQRETPAPDRDTLRPGGLGVQLIYRVFDEVKFAPGRRRGNRITMRLARRPEERA